MTKLTAALLRRSRMNNAFWNKDDLNMNAAFYEDLHTLCSTKVTSEEQADQIVDVLADLISDELTSLNDESREICCGTFVQSAAYRQDLLRSRERIVSWLVETDKLHMQRLLFIGLVILNDYKFLVPFIRESRLAVMAVVDTIWMYRFTEQELVRTFMIILFRICVYGELDDICIDACVSLDLVNYLYRAVVDDAESREPLMIIVALNDQYMLHDRRGSDNKVFSVLLTNTHKFSTLGSSLVLLFNRCGDDDQDLKIFISKFLYLLFSTPATRELLYTNDLFVLSQILIRELNDLPWEAVDVRAMYLRLLHAMLKYSLKQHCDAKLRRSLIEVLQLTLESAENLPLEDRSEIRRLTERCLEVPWLGASSADVAAESKADLMIQQDESFDSFRALSSNFPGRVHQVTLVPRRSSEYSQRPPIPPPPPPPPRHQSVASVASSSDSRQSLDAVEHFRPPPPPRRKRSARGSHES